MVSFLVSIVWQILLTGLLVSAATIRRRKSDIYYTYGSDEDDSDLPDDDNTFGGPIGVNEPKSPVDDFVPLSCNSNMNNACVGWTQYFGSNSVHDDRLVVQCGDCVTMDFSGLSITLNDGIDINGKLIFPEGYSVTLYTAGIVVQGELEIMSTQSPISGTPKIQVIMIGVDEERSFVPIGENAMACTRLELGNDSCLVGKKSVTVAGGRMNVHGIPVNAPTWTRLYDVSGGSVNSPTQIILQDSNGDIAKTWGVGASIIITSHTLNWTDQQLRTITNILSSGGNAILTLDSSIRRPTTLVESYDFAVEVALLSRNIRFQGGIEQDDGGHMWVFYTPTVIQTINGLEIRQFGQQGVLGRYPIHFHVSNDVVGSIVSNNSIWQSHQRCVVVHASNNLRIENNVAYDTAGHCFITENGIETGNHFIRNLGALTRVPDTIIPGSQNESDDEPATFWISNPYNFVEDNVGAGSKDSAFWYELRKRGPMSAMFPDPMLLPLGSFDNNVAHSNVGKTGAIRLYPTGYLPTISNYAIATGLKAYRNQGTGMFVHKVQNFQIKNALISDNAAIGIDVDRAEAIDIKDSMIIGKSNAYKTLMARDRSIAEICNRNRVIGLDLYSWRLRNEESGAIQVSNVDISGFRDISCRDRSPINMDPYTLKQGVFELFFTFEAMKIVDATTDINFCRAVTSSEPINSFYLLDLDGSLRPQGASTAVPATLVSLTSNMTTFVNMQQCKPIANRCYAYCAGTCFRSIRMDVDPRISEKLILKVCERTAQTKCGMFTGGRRVNGNDPYVNFPRSFFAHLPAGSYVASFVNQQGIETWPSFVAQYFEEDLCKASPDVIVNVPAVSTGQCSQLIYNGDFSLSSKDPTGWLNDLGGLELLPGQGSGGSNAISSSKVGSGTILQYLDSRCIKDGTKIRISVEFKLISDQLVTVPCIPDIQKCPKVGIGSDVTGKINVAVSDGAIDPQGFQHIAGDFVVDSRFASSTSFYVFVEWVEKNSSPVKRRIAIDQVSVEVLSQPASSEPSTNACSNLISNSDMEAGFDGYWQKGFGTSIWGFLLQSLQNTQGYQSPNAIKYSGFFLFPESGVLYSTATKMDFDCLTPGSRWEVTAKIRLSSWLGGGPDCNPANSCPCVEMEIKNGSGTSISAPLRACTYENGWRMNSFNDLSGTFVLPQSWDGSIKNVRLQIVGYPIGYEMTLDDLVISPM